VSWHKHKEYTTNFSCNFCDIREISSIPYWRMYTPPPSGRKASRRRAYSLIELLAVMAILSALFGLTVGSLSPVKANALTAGGNQIADLLTLARQNSLSRHAFTAVLVKSIGDARYSAFCLFELTRNDDGTFSNWKVAAPWKLLPEGIRFDPGAPVALPAVNFVGSNPGLPVALPGTTPFRGQTVNLAADVVYQVFAPDGTLTKGAPVRLRLVEGADNPGGGIIYTGTQTAGQPVNHYDIVVLAETGHVKVERP
jgi:prepilin-type N-terminal cleavage/methylation domain-containing protein